MSTTEKLFVQIFERKKRIIDQVKRQIDQFDHHLASICVLDGIAPPPWLLSPSFPSLVPDFDEMRKEELISEVLLKRSQIASAVLNCHYSLHQKSIVTAHNKGIPNASCTEDYASNNDTHAGNRLSALHLSPADDTQCTATANGVPDVDGSVTSPPDCTDARLSDYCQNPSPSLVNIQRSKSRQRALELRNSAKENKRKSCEDNHVGAHASQGTGYKINPSQYDPVDDLPLAKHVDATNESFRQVLESIESAGKKMSCDIDSDRNVRPVSCSQKTGSVDETGNDGNLSYTADSDGFNMSLDCPLPPPNCIIGLSDPSVLAKSSSMAEANIVESRGSKNNSMEFCNKTEESLTSTSQVSTQKEPLEAGNTSCHEEVDDEDKNSLEQPMKVASSNCEASRFFKSSPVISNAGYKVRKASIRDQEIKEKDIDIYAGRIARSRSSDGQINIMNESLELEKSEISSKENGVIKTKQMPDPTFELLELVKPFDITSVSCGVEARVRDSDKVDAETSAHGCGTTGSSSSSKKCNDFSKSPEKGVYNDVAKNGDGELLQSLGKSSKTLKQTSVVGEGVNLPNPAGIQANFLSTSVSITDENVANMYYNGIAENCPIASKSASTGVRCGAESSESRPPRDCATVVKPQQLDFDDIEDSILLKSFSLELENNQEGKTEKQLSPLLQSVDEVALHDSQKRPPTIPIKIPLQKVDASSKQEKCRKVSSEAILKDNADLVKKRTFSSARQELGSFNYQSSRANFLFMGTWPQHKRMKIGSQLTDCPSPSLVLKPCPPSNKYHIGDALQSDAIMSPVEGTGRDVEQQNLEQSEICLSKLHDDEVAINLELKGGGDALAPLLDEAATSVASLKRPAAGFSQDSLMDKPEAAYPNCADSCVTRHHTAEDNQPLSQVSYDKDALQETDYHFGGKKSLSHFSSSSPSNLSDVGTDQHMPEYEGFFMDSDTERPSTTNEEIDFEKLDHPSTALRMGSVLDQLCKSTSLCTPLTHTKGYELHEALNMCSSLPNGVLEGIELKNLHMDCNECKLLCSSYSCLNEGVIDDLCERSQSVSSLHNALSAWDISKPCMSPVKFWDLMPPKSSSSSKRISSIPELPCISEENENADGMADTLLEDSFPQMKMSLVKREALADIRNNSNPPTSVCEAKIQDDGFSVASVNTELGYSGTCYRSKKKLTDHNRKRFTSKDKENQNISLGGDGAKRSKGPPRSRFSKPKVSDKLGTRNGGPSLSEKEPKRKNIVSNITSFVPLVQQKQAAAVVTGKRDIKVKALEAAEAAKRLADKKENERKMKKEALKIERAKMEEANLRELKLEKRKTEEERKKKDADMAAKKRQREEEERKERERKKRRVEEAKRNHQDNEKKLQKESKFKAANERARDKKESKKMEKSSSENNHQTVPVIKPATIEVSTNAIIYEALSGDSSKVTGKPSENHGLVCNINEEQSYEISPYKDSDNEDEDEEEENRRNKYRPSWASKSQLALAVSAQQNIDAKLLFPQERCHGTWKVLLPRKLQRIS